MRHSAGFHGKVPSHGDFVSRRLPRAFVDPWDRWLAGVVAASRGTLGERWLEFYLNAPVWRFALAAGICGDPPWGGVVMPSVDRVGRYYPLTVAAPLLYGDPLTTLAGDPPWFERAETVARGALDRQLDLERFDAAVLALELPGGDSLGAAGAVLAWPAASAAVSLPHGTPHAAALPRLFAALLRRQRFAGTLWWSDGSAAVPPSLLLFEGLPDAAGYVAMLSDCR